MAQNINAEIISIGTEILLGELTDTNSVFISRTFRDLGINVYFMTSVGDNRGRIADAIRIALSRAQIVITCGGLGPTVDDMTRQSIADATDRELEFQQELLDKIAERFKGYQVKMTENNRQQAFLPENAILIENPVGTAPSFVVEHNDGIVISLPGVPREMKYLMTEKIVPFLRERYHLGIIKAYTLKVAGIGESSLDDLIGREILESSNPTVGLAAHHGDIDVRITAKAETEALADEMIAEMDARIRERVGNYVFGVNEETLEQVLIQLLHSKNAKLAVVEAGTGGAITNVLQPVEHAHEVLITNELLPHRDSLQEKYNLPENLTRREISARVAEITHKETNADIVIVAASDPDVNEGSDTDESTVVTIFTPKKTSDRVYGFGGKSELAPSWIPRWALSRAWHFMSE